MRWEETEVMLQVEMSRTVEKKEEAIRLADEGKFAEAAELIRNQHKTLYSYTKEAPFQYKQELADEMEHLAASLHNLREEYYDAIPVRKWRMKVINGGEIKNKGRKLSESMENSYMR